MIYASQKNIKELAKSIDLDSYPVVDQIEYVDSDQKQRVFKVVDFDWYANELTYLEEWYLGKLDIGTVTVDREFVEIEPSLIEKGPHGKWGERDFMYQTTMTDSRFSEDQLVATICLVHGYAENSSVCFTEAGLMFAMNGFRVVMIDTKGFGYSSGTRSTGYNIYENHEFFAHMLKGIKS